MTNDPIFVKGDRVCGNGIKIARAKTGTVHCHAERLTLTDGTVIDWYAVNWDDTGWSPRVCGDAIEAALEPGAVTNPILQPLSVPSARISEGSISVAHIADAAVAPETTPDV